MPRNVVRSMHSTIAVLIRPSPRICSITLPSNLMPCASIATIATISPSTLFGGRRVPMSRADRLPRARSGLTRRPCIGCAVEAELTDLIGAQSSSSSDCRLLQPHQLATIASIGSHLWCAQTRRRQASLIHRDFGAPFGALRCFAIKTLGFGRAAATLPIAGDDDRLFARFRD